MTTNNDQPMNTETNISAALSDPKSLAAMTDAVLTDAEAGDVWAHAVMTGHRASWSIDEPDTAAETLRKAIARAEASASQPAPDEQREKAIEAWQKRCEAWIAVFLGPKPKKGN